MGWGGQGSNHVEEMVYILDMGGEGFNKDLKVGTNVSRYMFSGETIGGVDGTAGVTRFM